MVSRRRRRQYYALGTNRRSTTRLAWNKNIAWRRGWHIDIIAMIAVAMPVIMHVVAVMNLLLLLHLLLVSRMHYRWNTFRRRILRRVHH